MDKIVFDILDILEYLTGLGEEVLKISLPLPNFEVTPLGSSLKCRCFLF